SSRIRRRRSAPRSRLRDSGTRAPPTHRNTGIAGRLGGGGSADEHPPFYKKGLRQRRQWLKRRSRSAYTDSGAKEGVLPLGCRGPVRNDESPQQPQPGKPSRREREIGRILRAPAPHRSQINPQRLALLI